MDIFTQTKDQYEKETYLNLKNYDIRVGKYINGIFETCTAREKESLSYTTYL